MTQITIKPNRIRVLMAFHQMDMKQLAERSGLQRQEITRLLYEPEYCDQVQVQRLAHAFNTKPGALTDERAELRLKFNDAQKEQP